MEQEIKWEVSYYTDANKYYMTVNGERVGDGIHTRMTADRMIGWLLSAAPDIAKIVSKELGGG